MHNQARVILFTAIAVGTKVGLYISGPLYLDSLNRNTSDCGGNCSGHGNDTGETRQVDPLFAALAQASFFTVTFGVILLAILIFTPGQITDAERNFPKRYYVITGAANGVSALILNYALSGTRTPTYLLALLGNFLVPSQFVIRFFLLRKMPTRRKLLCAVAVMVAEFVCLLPKIVPSLDRNGAKTSGGASGLAGVLWPLSFVIGLIPGTLNNAYMEKGVKGRQDTLTSNTDEYDDDDDDDEMDDVIPANDFTQINMFFYLFWYSLSFLMTLVLFFWTDLIPGYGTASSAKEFGERMAFNTLCIFGQRGCDYYVVLLAWANMVGNWLACLGNAYLLRYSEGANFMMVAMTLRSPFGFIFWTLFEEGSTITWHPRMSLSTILGIVALVIMVPAVHIYNTGSPERTMLSFRWPFWTEDNLVPITTTDTKRVGMEGDDSTSDDRDALISPEGNNIQRRVET